MTTIPMSELRRISAEHGQHWFSRDTMRFFKSRIPNYAFRRDNEAFFVSSEQAGFEPSSGRAFSIRKMNLSTGVMDTVGEFGQYSSRQTAMSALKELLK